MFKIDYLIFFLPFYLFAQGQYSDKNTEYNIPLLDGNEIEIDGIIDEEVWSNSLSLSNFTSYLPVDGRPADDNTDVHIWYSTKSLYIAITAYEVHGEVRSTLADRDNLENDDYILFSSKIGNCVTAASNVIDMIKR